MSDNGSPSIRALAIADARSSVGFSRRDAVSAVKYWNISSSADICSTDVAPRLYSSSAVGPCHDPGGRKIPLALLLRLRPCSPKPFARAVVAVDVAGLSLGNLPRSPPAMLRIGLAGVRVSAGDGDVGRASGLHAKRLRDADRPIGPGHGDRGSLCAGDDPASSRSSPWSSAWRPAPTERPLAVGPMRRLSSYLVVEPSRAILTRGSSAYVWPWEISH